jgi:hypothetical protein
VFRTWTGCGAHDRGGSTGDLFVAQHLQDGRSEEGTGMQQPEFRLHPEALVRVAFVRQRLAI